MENKKDIIFRLKLLLKITSAGEDIEDMELSDDEETVHIRFKDGYKRDVNIACDSGAAIIEDVVKVLI